MRLYHNPSNIMRLNLTPMTTLYLTLLVTSLFTGVTSLLLFNSERGFFFAVGISATCLVTSLYQLFLQRNPLYVMNCHVHGCYEPGFFYPTINIPARDVPIAEHDPVVAHLSLCLCGFHRSTATAEHFIDSNTQIGQIVRLKADAATAGLQAPDYSRAFLTFSSLPPVTRN